MAYIECGQLKFGESAGLLFLCMPLRILKFEKVDEANEVRSKWDKLSHISFLVVSDFRSKHMLVFLHVPRKPAIIQCHINFIYLIDSSWLMEVFLFHPSFCLQGQDNWKKMFSEEVMQKLFWKNKCKANYIFLFILSSCYFLVFTWSRL